MPPCGINNQHIGKVACFKSNDTIAGVDDGGRMSIEQVISARRNG